jgi:arylsulfatase A-like enzyme
MPLLLRALLALCLTAAAAGAAAVERRPDVLLIVVDTLRADYLPVYGFPQQTSPQIAGLAERGVVFDRGVASSGSTVPSHASIFSSRYVREHSVGYLNGRTSLVGSKTLAESFREAGYVTAAFVSNVMLKRLSGLDSGFDHYDDELPEYEANRAIPERDAEQTTARALAWLAQQGEAPIFLWVHYQEPHGPYTPPAALTGRFRVPPDRYEKRLPVQDHNLGLDGIPAYQALPGLDLPSQYRGRYAGEIFHADASIGKLLEAVRSRRPGAVALLTADHGESFGENNRYLVHGYATTPNVAHVPFILEAPGIAPGRRREVVSHVDVMPTLLELAGVAIPDPVSGAALGPLLRGERELPERWVYCDIGRELSAYRGDHFVRLLGVEGPWQPGGEASRPLWVWHEWSRGNWKRVPGGDLDEAIRGYADNVVPAHRVQLSGSAIEMLRSLGYVED